ncbi:Pentapeptide repeat-containing protein [Planktothrix serta PCC 8927]|uniref:Pentapeptide repeat-containing protein n=1 Tax=Planktothrix serta PCC 8927 TaxID=671068 RepID=A0A7Z9BR22_9CYAN|nr:pentapeptide repeat-containing protein [Planktothrix serta]VXD20840.1 Pentapeptide repeat-containing protein [Planktothrix serta PCC 8927]
MTSPTLGRDTDQSQSPSSWPDVPSQSLPFWVRRWGALVAEVSLVAVSGLIPFTLGVVSNRSSQPVPLNPVVRVTSQTVAATLGIPVRDRSPKVAPLTNLFWSGALLLPMVVGGWQLYLLAKRGQTLPKLWFGVQVVNPNGSPPGWGRAISREFIGRWGMTLGIAYGLWQVTGAYPNLLILGALSGVTLLGDALIAKRFQGRTGHDLLAGTSVQEAPPILVFNPFTNYDWVAEDDGVHAIVITPETGKQEFNLWAWMRQHPGLTLIIVSSASLAAVLGTFVGTQIYIQNQANRREFQQQDNEVFLALVSKLSPNASTDVAQKRGAILALGAIKDPRAIPLLVDLLAQEGNPVLIDVTQQALVSTGPEALPHLRRLNQALKNDLDSMQFGAENQEKQLTGRRQQATQRAIAKILKVYGGFIHNTDLSRIDLGQNTTPPVQFTLVLEQTDLSGINFRNTNLTKASLKNSRFASAGEDGRLETFDDWVSDLSGADLTEADLTGAFLSNTLLKYSNFLKANLNKANLSSSDLTGANFSKAQLLGSNLQGANLTDAKFTGAELASANLSNTNLKTARFSEAKAPGANFQSSNLKQANFKNTDVSAVNFTGANLQEADLTSAKLTGSNFKNARLQDANLKNANLSLVNFQGAKLDGTNFKGAIFVSSQQNKPDQFITTSEDMSKSNRLKKVDFSNAINLDNNQIQYICAQGGIHPDCPPPEGKK